MTSAARETLEDCRGALIELVDGIQGREWRRKWILSVVLLRAVGHVLHKVDRERSPAYRLAVDTWWSGLKESKPAPAIFWSLIDKERNSILKEYRTTVGQGVTIQLSGVSTGKQKSEPPNPAKYHYTFNSGPYKDRDQRDVISEAIVWWEAQLNSIDGGASAP